jgi:hypothetical protein
MVIAQAGLLMSSLHSVKRLVDFRDLRAGGVESSDADQIFHGSEVAC